MMFIYERKLIIYIILNRIERIGIKCIFILFQFFLLSNAQAQNTVCSLDTSFATSYYYPHEEIIFFAGTIITNDNATLMVSQSRERPSGEKDILIAKVDQKGIPLWTKKIVAEFSNIAAMVATSEGFVFAINGFTQKGSNIKYLFLFCLNDNGQIKWQNKYLVNNLALPNELVQMQDAGNGFVDVMVSVWGGVHPTHASIDGDFFYFQIDKNGQPNTKAFIFDGSYGNYDFFSQLMGLKRDISDANKINLYVLNQINEGRSQRTYPSFCNSIYGYSHFQLDVNKKKTSLSKYFCPGIIDTLPPNVVLGLSPIEPRYSFALQADGSATFTHRNASRLYFHILMTQKISLVALPCTNYL